LPVAFPDHPALVLSTKLLAPAPCGAAMQRCQRFDFFFAFLAFFAFFFGIIFLTVFLAFLATDFAASTTRLVTDFFFDFLAM
jgi:hypothetical protein